ncbi:hypothetical protein D026_4260B, partial [Vibrio parahaemolyticus 605]
RKMNKTEN